MDNDAAKAMLARALSLSDAGEARDLYRQWACTYDDTMLRGLGYLTPAKTARLLARYLPERDARILDVGSGTGLAGGELAGHGFGNIEALDFSPQMLAVARARGVYVQTIEADLNLPLEIATACYDALICTGTFTHSHVGAGCLDELFRVLRPGGIFACTIHKQVWEPAGFARKVEEMRRAQKLGVLSHEPGAFYDNSTEPEGFYIAWQNTAQPG